jgi:transketolase
VIFSRHHNLSNLSIVIDLNGLQGFGTTREVASLEPMAEKLRAFGLPTEEVDGHDHRALGRALQVKPGDGPNAIVAHTRKGCGVSFMENRMEWHYLPMNESEYLEAVQEVERACETPSARPCSKPLAAPNLSS